MLVSVLNLNNKGAEDNENGSGSNGTGGPAGRLANYGNA
jgi:hypothetical protein